MRARYKEQDLLVQQSWSQERSTTQNGPWSTIASGAWKFQGAKRVMSGFDNENFHARRREGELLPYTPFYQEEAVYGTNTGGRYGPVKKGSYYYKIDQGEWCTGVIQSALNLDALVTEAKDYAQDLDPAPMVQAAAARVYSQGHDSLTFLIELRKTAALFNGLVDRLKSLLQLSKAAENWLEFRYGWRILWYDIVELSDIINRMDKKRKRFSDRVGQSQTHVTSGTLSYDDGGIRATLPWSSEFNTSIRGSITADISPPDFQFNPVLTGWEVIKFSFIIDWFIGVGTWLEALSFLVYQTDYVAAGGSLVTARKTITTSGVTPEFYNATLGSNGAIDFGGPWELNVTLTTRTPMSVPLHPYANINLDVYKVVDLVAILRGLVRGFSGSLRL